MWSLSWDFPAKTLSTLCHMYHPSYFP
jgi:hypothetical protein